MSAHSQPSLAYLRISQTAYRFLSASRRNRRLAGGQFIARMRPSHYGLSAKRSYRSRAFSTIDWEKQKPFA